MLSAKAAIGRGLSAREGGSWARAGCWKEKALRCWWVILNKPCGKQDMLYSTLIFMVDWGNMPILSNSATLCSRHKTCRRFASPLHLCGLLGVVELWGVLTWMLVDLHDHTFVFSFSAFGQTVSAFTLNRVLPSCDSSRWETSWMIGTAMALTTTEVTEITEVFESSEKTSSRNLLGQWPVGIPWCQPTAEIHHSTPQVGQAKRSNKTPFDKTSFWIRNQ